MTTAVIMVCYLPRIFSNVTIDDMEREINENALAIRELGFKDGVPLTIRFPKMETSDSKKNILIEAFGIKSAGKETGRLHEKLARDLVNVLYEYIPRSTIECSVHSNGKKTGHAKYVPH